MGPIGSITSAVQGVHSALAIRKVVETPTPAPTTDSDGDGDRSPSGPGSEAPGKGQRIDVYA
jgi:hypothetical protein